jgi:hypothetical protein
MRLTDFKLTDPTPGTLSILRDELTDEVKGIAIHRTDCSLSQYDSSLGKLTGMVINVGEGINVTVNEVERFGSYYYLNVTPFTYSELDNPEVCVEIKLTPFDENISIDFRNSVFYPLYNNVPENLTQATLNTIFEGKIEVRRGKNIYDVDRKNDAIVPTNITNLLEGTANLAEFPESNYSTLANITGRYLGSKTSVEDYGTNPSVAIINVDGALYSTELSGSYICSQSFDERPLQEIGLDTSNNLFPAKNLLPTASRDIGVFDGYIPGDAVTPATVTATQATFDIGWFTARNFNLKPEAIVMLRTVIDSTPYEEYVEITSIVRNNTVTGINSAFTGYTITVRRGVGGSSRAFLATGTNNYNITLHTIYSDTVYTYDTNKLVRITNKKLYVQETGEIYRIGPKGRLLLKEETCSI